MSGSLKKGVAVVFAANIINLILSLARNFILPKYLSIEVYADIKLYQLYISYAGIATMGYIDGMYLKYGGKEISSIDFSAFGKNLSTFRLFQLFVSTVVVILGWRLKTFALVAMGLTILAINITDYYKCFYQATGEFKLYSRIMNLSSVLMFAANVVLLLVGSVTSWHYIVGYIIVYYFIWLLLEFISRKHEGIQYLYFSKKEMAISIKDGFFLMWGLLISNFMTGLDRWCVKFTMDTTAFAMYSFAASVEGFLSYAISPVSITLYNYFCKENAEEKINNIRQMIIVFSSVIIAAAFPVKYILEVYLDKYSQATSVLFILFAGQMIYAVIRCFYVNIYKARKAQNRYFRNIVFVLISGVIFNITLFLIAHKMEAFAIGTLLAAVVWLLLSVRDYPEYRYTSKDSIYTFLIVGLFIMTGVHLNAIMGCLVYCVGMLILILLFFPDSVKQAVKVIKKMSGKIGKRGIT